MVRSRSCIHLTLLTYDDGTWWTQATKMESFWNWLVNITSNNMAIDYCYGRHIVILCCYGSKRNSFGNECSLGGTVRYGSTLRLIRGEFGKKFMCHCKSVCSFVHLMYLESFHFFGYKDLLCKLEHIALHNCVSTASYIHIYVLTYNG